MPIKYLPRFTRQYERLTPDIRQKVKKTLNFLDTNFRHPGLRSHPIKGSPGIFEAYVDDKYRITFERHGDNFVMRNIDNHDECLKNP